MAFKGEIALGALNSKYKYGFTVGDIYRVQGAGNLVPNNLPVANGAFVKWTADGWEVQSDMQYAVSESGESLDEVAANLLDDHDPVDTKITDVSKAFYDDHELGYYYAIGDKVWLCTERTRSGEPGSYTYSTELTKQNGIVPVLNRLIDRIAALENA